MEISLTPNHSNFDLRQSSNSPPPFGEARLQNATMADALSMEIEFTLVSE